MDYHNNLAPFTQFLLAECLNQSYSTMLDSAPIVELGAGAGFVGSLLPGHCRNRYIQTEIGEENCRIAQQRNADVITLCAKAQELPFKPEAIGGIIARNVLDMVDTRAVLHETARVLQPGGTLVHIRDHRPSLAWIQDQISIGPNQQLVPYFDTDGSFQRYQVVAAKNLKKIVTANSPIPVDNLSNPHFQEAVSGGSQTDGRVDDLKAVCARISPHKERVTPTFTKIMDQRLGKWLREVGLEPVFSVENLEVELPKAYAVANSWPAHGNSLVGYADGYFSIFNNPDLPTDQVYVSQEINIVTAVKHFRPQQKNRSALPNGQ